MNINTTNQCINFIDKCERAFNLRGSKLNYRFLLNGEAFFEFEQRASMRMLKDKIDLSAAYLPGGKGTICGHPVQRAHSSHPIQLSIMPEAIT